MGLLADYLVRNDDNRLQVYFSDIRQEGAIEHICLLPNQLWLIREITDQLAVMGFEFEFDREVHDDHELHIVASHTTPKGVGNSADAIRAVCSRHAIEADITSGEGHGLVPPILS